MGPVLTMTTSGVGSTVGVLVGNGVIVGVGVLVGTIVKSGVGVSVGIIWTAPTQEESRTEVKRRSKNERWISLMVFPSFHPMGVCVFFIKHNGKWNL